MSSVNISPLKSEKNGNISQKDQKQQQSTSNISIQQSAQQNENQMKSQQQQNENQSTSANQNLESQQQQQQNHNISNMHSQSVQERYKERIINGFTRRPHILQLISYIFLIIDIFVFIFLIIPFYSPVMQIIVSVIYFVSLLIMSYYGYVCTKIDPTDSVVNLEKKSKREGSYFSTTRFEFYCNTCQTHCLESSKHCKQCDRCVEGFDHHCKWLNNCIGSKNYKQFAILIGVVMINSISFCIFALLVFIENIDKSTDTLNKKLFISSDYDNLKYITYVVAVLNFFFFVLDLNLGLFHVYLRYNKLTTYDYIINKRNSVKNQKLQRPSSPYKTKKSTINNVFCCAKKDQKKRKSQIHNINNKSKNNNDIQQLDLQNQQSEDRQSLQESNNDNSNNNNQRSKQITQQYIIKNENSSSNNNNQDLIENKSTQNKHNNSAQQLEKFQLTDQQQQNINLQQQPEQKQSQITIEGKHQTIIRSNNINNDNSNENDENSNQNNKNNKLINQNLFSNFLVEKGGCGSVEDENNININPKSDDENLTDAEGDHNNIKQQNQNNKNNLNNGKFKEFQL